MLQMKKLLIYFTCFLCLVGCQKNDIQVHNGENTSLNKLDGSWVVINYWADWCPPCLKEMPELVKFSNQNSDINVILDIYHYQVLRLILTNLLLVMVLQRLSQLTLVDRLMIF